jgi:hypothetical protein
LKIFLAGFLLPVGLTAEVVIFSLLHLLPCVIEEERTDVQENIALNEVVAGRKDLLQFMRCLCSFVFGGARTD